MSDVRQFKSGMYTVTASPGMIQVAKVRAPWDEAAIATPFAVLSFVGVVIFTASTGLVLFSNWPSARAFQLFFLMTSLGGGVLSLLMTHQIITIVFATTTSVWEDDQSIYVQRGIGRVRLLRGVFRRPVRAIVDVYPASGGGWIYQLRIKGRFWSRSVLQPPGKHASCKSARREADELSEIFRQYLDADVEVRQRYSASGKRIIKS